MDSSVTAKSAFVSVYLTLISMIQAIVLESLASRFFEVFEAGELTIGRSLQFAFLFQVVIYIWVAYTVITSSARWLLTGQDLVSPFLIGALQFTAIAFSGLPGSRVFLVVAGAGFVGAVLISLDNRRKAALEVENARFVRSYPWLLVQVLLGGVGAVCWLAAASPRAVEVTLFVLALIVGNALLAWVTIAHIRWWSRFHAPAA